MDALKLGGAIREAKFPGDDLLREITLTDEKRNDKDARSEGAAQHAGDAGFLFPKRLKHIRENETPAEFIRVQAGGSGRFGVQGRAMANEDEGGVVVVLLH